LGELGARDSTRRCQTVAGSHRLMQEAAQRCTFKHRYGQW